MSAPRHLATGKPAEPGQYLLRRRAGIVVPRLPEGARVLLDLGCGNGAQAAMMTGGFRLVVGLDLNPAFLAGFRKGTERAGGAVTAAVVGDGASLPLRPESVDCLTSFEVLEHVADEEATLAEMYRVLRPGGRLILSVPNKWWIFETHGARLPLLPWNRVPFFSWLPTPIHERFARARIYTRARITARVREAGFRLMETFYLTAPMDMLRWSPARRLLRSTLFAPDTTRCPCLATSILVVADRPGSGPS